MYLSGFALTLIFVIARLVELMQETVNSDEEKDILTKRLKDVSDNAESRQSAPVTDISPSTETNGIRKRTNATSTDKKTS